MTAVYAPREDQIPIAPELATLSALDAALRAADQLLCLQHDLQSPSELRQPDTKIASIIVRRARGLRDLIEHYVLATVGEEFER